MKRKVVAKTKTPTAAAGTVHARQTPSTPAPVATAPHESAFREVLALIERARARAYHAANTELIDLYWRIGEYISRKLRAAEWGDRVVEELARYLARTQPGLRGFTRRNLFRMRQFYEMYCGDKLVSPLVTQLSWTHNLLILSRCKRTEEREFYLRVAHRERWGKRELERQINTSLFERAVLSPPKVAAALRQSHPDAADIFKDAYVVEFLQLPEGHLEADLHRGLLAKLKEFLVELGRDFCFVGSQYPIQVGGQDFALDLLFFNRALNCLVAFDLKVTRFEPEHLGKMSFYLEALDRDVRKPHERPSIGVLLCATKDNEVVEYSLSRSLSPALIAEYQTALPDKRLLQRKLHEFYQLALPFERPTPATPPRKKHP
jgi:predicted nuclease of restriction endonuclease-like (RecB) superfamily